MISSTLKILIALFILAVLFSWAFQLGFGAG